MRKTILVLSAACVLGAGGGVAHAAGGAVSVAFAGSMGAVMDHGIGPAFTKQSGEIVQGRGAGALGLAHLIVAKTITPDVFISISPGPIKVVEEAHIAAGQAVPVATTAVVLAYDTKSPFAASIKKDGVKALAQPKLRFGRTNPATDPLGQYSLFALQRAEAIYHLPGFAAKVAGPNENPRQIFTEPSILARLAAGQIDASFAYQSYAFSQHVPYVTLPDTLNFSNPALAAEYAKASLTMTVKGKTVTAHPGPLVFYAVALRDAPHPAAAKAFIAFLQSAAGQKILHDFGYGPPKGGAL
ncbi:MAG: extracellular solute-binding protein [Rhodospirillales bacterium]|nr:extracellular solute-binding protein [Rhodospirillales bacterium]